MSPANHLRPSGESYADVLLELGDALHVGILAVDRELHITRWNRWLEVASGTPAAAVLGRPVADAVPGIRPGGVAALERAVHGATVVLSQPLHGRFISLPPSPTRPDLPEMQQSVRILPVLDEANEPCGAAVVIEDVTERVVRERELREAMELAQSANQAKSDFLAAMSHELRTPIGAITGYADLLSDGMFGDLTEEQRQQTRRIRSVGTHLLGIVDEILAFARLEAGREETHLGDFDAAAVARAAIDAIAPQLVQKGVELVARIPSGALPMHSDEMKIRQILINLLGNAAKFTDEGSVTLEVAPSDDGTTIAFVVADTGPGISEDDQTRIFDAFTQVHAPYARPHGGTGLGLTVSRRFARMLGGDLMVVSETGRGSTFTAEIPSGR